MYYFYKLAKCWTVWHAKKTGSKFNNRNASVRNSIPAGTLNCNLWFSSGFRTLPLFQIQTLSRTHLYLIYAFLFFTREMYFFYAGSTWRQHVRICATLLFFIKSWVHTNHITSLVLLNTWLDDAYCVMLWYV